MRNNRFFAFFAILALGLIMISNSAAAQDGVILTISPPITNLKMNPGEKWTSAIRLVNNSDTPVSANVELADFTSNEEGGVKLLPPATGPEASSYALSQWIEINKDPVEIPAQAGVDIPFSIVVPENAEPCGHYGAILAGNKPGGEIQGSGIKISSMLASLILLKVNGECAEHGSIREFSTDKNIYTAPQADFNLRFENTGNIHLQPQGEIKIYDMLGKEKGTIPINHDTEYGRVLPNSLREWKFSWTGGNELTGMGRYKAVLILGYGDKARETADQTVYFWLIYPMPLLVIAGSLLLFILLFTVGARAYIRRAIIRSSQEAGVISRSNLNNAKKISVIPRDRNGHEYTSKVEKISNE
jgi:hypothetical protein